MNYFPQLITLSGIILLACASPGPDFVAVTSCALQDRRSGICMGLGIGCAIILWASLAVLGFGLLIEKMFWLYEIIRLVGAVYLVYLGSRILMSTLKGASAEAGVAKASAVSAGQAWRRGVLVSLTNPKAAAFFSTLFVTLLPIHAPAWVYIVVVGLTGLIACLWFSLLAAFFSVGGVRSIYMRIRRPVDILMGAVLVGLGIRLAVSR
jgi:threonine/homoserine/homoserine lactone efflux protein